MGLTPGARAEFEYSFAFHCVRDDRASGRCTARSIGFLVPFACQQRATHAPTNASFFACVQTAAGSDLQLVATASLFRGTCASFDVFCCASKPLYQSYIRFASKTVQVAFKFVEDARTREK